MRPCPAVGDALLADQRCMAFKGTSATYGRGSGVVVATGMATALGRIADLMQEHAAGQTPLQIRLATLGRALAGAALVICLIVFALGVARGESVELMFLTAVSLAVAAIPEALPAVVTISLALGAQRMARRRALVRKLPAVETLGSVTVVCSDKTGTLTQNRMLVERVWTPDGEYDVAGVGYEPVGAITGEADPSRRPLPPFAGPRRGRLQRRDPPRPEALDRRLGRDRRPDRGRAPRPGRQARGQPAGPRGDPPPDGRDPVRRGTPADVHAARGRGRGLGRGQGRARGAGPARRPGRSRRLGAGHRGRGALRRRRAIACSPSPSSG